MIHIRAFEDNSFTLGFGPFVSKSSLIAEALEVLYSMNHNACSPIYLYRIQLSQFPESSCLMKTTISAFSTVPELSLSKVAKTSSNASSENSSPPLKLPRVSLTNFLVSSLSSAPLLSTSYVSQI